MSNLMWENFAAGYWQKEVPTRVGKYPTADRDGNQASDIMVVQLANGEIKSTHKIQFKCEWGGWWWSEPYPELPHPPKW